MDTTTEDETMTYLEKEAQRERACAMTLQEVAAAAAWVDAVRAETIAELDRQALPRCPFGEPNCTDPTHAKLAAILAR